MHVPPELVSLGCMGGHTSGTKAVLLLPCEEVFKYCENKHVKQGSTCMFEVKVCFEQHPAMECPTRWKD